MSAQARTAGPWKIHKLGFDTCDIGSESENQLTCTAFGFGVEHTEANAAFIVKACNAHDELVAALEKIEKALRTDSRQKSILGDYVEYHLDGGTMYLAINAARVALAKVQP